MNNHGGKRPGAGRPKLPAAKRRVVLSVRVKQETRRAIERQARATRMSAGKVVDRAFWGVVP